MRGKGEARQGSLWDRSHDVGLGLGVPVAQGALSGWDEEEFKGWRFLQDWGERLGIQARDSCRTSDVRRWGPGQARISAG